MIAMWNRLVATARSVMVICVVPVAAVARRTCVRILFAYAHPVLVEMTVMWEMQVTVMQVVSMPVVHDCRVTAAGPVAMRMTLVRLVLHLGPRGKGQLGELVEYGRRVDRTTNGMQSRIENRPRK